LVRLVFLSNSLGTPFPFGASLLRKVGWSCPFFGLGPLKPWRNVDNFLSSSPTKPRDRG
jgi:hypothetical protein